MKLNLFNLFIEINTKNFVFLVGENNEHNKFSLIYKETIPLSGISNKKIMNFELVYETIQKKIFYIEQKINFNFKEVILLINNFDCSIINLSGYKKLNGSQLVKENITYILNSLKTKINEIEKKKFILHIFNTKFQLDKKKTSNIPIGLFGDFYSHELSFFLISKNDYKNIQNIFEKCNLKVSKIISKKFIEGVTLINDNINLEKFIKIEIDENFSQINFFDNSSLKFFQDFNFGISLLINDVCKVTALDKSLVINILKNSDFSKKDFENDFIEREYFSENNFRKIRKKLIFDIIEARIQELSEIFIKKNLNIESFTKEKFPIFFLIKDNLNIDLFKDIFLKQFLKGNEQNISFIEEPSIEQFYENVNNIVQFGWKKEAIPITQNKQSIITRFFKSFFG